MTKFNIPDPNIELPKDLDSPITAGAQRFIQAIDEIESQGSPVRDLNTLLDRDPLNPNAEDNAIKRLLAEDQIIPVLTDIFVTTQNADATHADVFRKGATVYLTQTRGGALKLRDAYIFARGGDLASVKILLHKMFEAIIDELTKHQSPDPLRGEKLPPAIATTTAATHARVAATQKGGKNAAYWAEFFRGGDHQPHSPSIFHDPPPLPINGLAAGGIAGDGIRQKKRPKNAS